MNTAMLVKYLIPTIADPIVLGTITFSDATTADIIDSEGNYFLSETEARDAVTGAGKTYTDVVKVDIGPNCQELENEAFRNVSPYLWDPSQGVDLSNATGLTKIERSVFNSWRTANTTGDLVIPETVQLIGVDSLGGSCYDTDCCGFADRGVFSYWENMTHGVNFGTNSQLTHISCFAFRDWVLADMASNLVIPKTVEVIGNQCFEDWRSMTKGVEFQAGGTQPLELKPGSFSRWDSANMSADLYIPARISVLDSAFPDWESNTKGVVIDPSTTLTVIGDNSFRNWFLADMASNLVIPDSVQNIEYGAFQNWNAMTKGVDLGSGIVSTDSFAFSGWSSANMASDLVIPSSMTTIGGYSFQNWSSNTKGVDFTSASSLVTIGNRSFAGWINADMSSDLSIPSNIQFLEFGAFYNWNAMTKGVNFNGNTNITSIPERAFANWYNADMSSDLVIPSNVVNIGDISGYSPDYRTFCNWTSMTKGVDMSSCASLETIGNHAFYNWTSANMTELVIPANVTEIGAGAFQNWNSMTGTLRFLGLVPPLFVELGTNIRYQFANWAAPIDVFVPTGADLTTWKSALGVGNIGNFASINGVPWASIP